MAELSELELLRDLTVAQRVRIAELEEQLRSASRGFTAVEANVREVRNGVARTLTGILPAASVDIVGQAHDVVLNSIAREQRQIAAALSLPTEPRPLPEGVIPISRKRAHSSGRVGPAYEGSDFFTRVRTSANPSETEKE